MRRHAATVLLPGLFSPAAVLGPRPARAHPPDAPDFFNQVRTADFLLCAGWWF